MFEVILNSPWYTYLALPLFIFIARIIDVGMGTIRVIFITKGFKLWAPIIGFFELLIWILAIRQIFTNLDNPITYLAYAGGFAIGTYVGMRIEEKLSMGKVSVRAITSNKPDKLIKELKKAKYSVTVITGKGSGGNVDIIFSIIDRADLKEFVKLLHDFDDDVFYTIEDLRYAFEKHPPKLKKLHRFGSYRKGK